MHYQNTVKYPQRNVQNTKKILHFDHRLKYKIFNIKINIYKLYIYTQ